jgi:hypothetical protein
MSQQLHAVTDSQYWKTAFKHKTGELRRLRIIHATRPPTQDQAARLEGQHLLRWRVVVKKLTIDPGFANTPSDELAVLGAKVEDGNCLTAGAGGGHASVTPQR